MRIIIYVQDMRASGVVRMMIAMARRFAEADEVVLLAGHAAGMFGADDVSPARFVAARQTVSGSMPRLTVVPHVRRALRDLQPDVILSGGNFGHFSIWAATRRLGLPVVYVFSNAMERDGQPWRNLWRRFWSGLMVRGSAGAILVGGNLARSGTFAPHVASGKAVLIANGIDLQAIPAPDKALPDAMSGLDPVVLSIGRLQPQKGFEALIAAVAWARRSRPMRLVILGAGANAYRTALIQHARELGIEAYVLFAGTTDDVYPWLRSARVFALASRWEGSSIALLEAMAAGTPIVASRTAGDAADVLDQGRYGLLVDADDTPGFAAALLHQIDTPVLPGSRVQAFDAAAMMRGYHEVLTAATARHDAKVRPRADETRPSR